MQKYGEKGEEECHWAWCPREEFPVHICRGQRCQCRSAAKLTDPSILPIIIAIIMMKIINHNP